MNTRYTKKEFEKLLTEKLFNEFAIDIASATDEQIYRALALIARGMLSEKRKRFIARTYGANGKQVYYLCMEFLMGRSLKTSLLNLGLCGVADEVLMRVNDALTAFPNILLALVFIAMLGFGKYNVILALGVAFIPSFARVVRAEFARHRSMNYVKSARLMGASHLRIIFRHILPNTWDVLLPALVIGFNNAVLAEASMSYLGIGVAPPDISLGYMLSESQSYMIKAPWYVLCTGLVIVLLILGVSMMGDGLEKGGA